MLNRTKQGLDTIDAYTCDGCQTVISSGPPILMARGPQSATNISCLTLWDLCPSCRVHVLETLAGLIGPGRIPDYSLEPNWRNLTPVTGRLTSKEPNLKVTQYTHKVEIDPKKLKE